MIALYFGYLDSLRRPATTLRKATISSSGLSFLRPVTSSGSETVMDPSSAPAISDSSSAVMPNPASTLNALEDFETMEANIPAAENSGVPDEMLMKMSRSSPYFLRRPLMTSMMPPSTSL